MRLKPAHPSCPPQGVLTGEDLSVLLGGEQRCDLADWRANTVLSEGMDADDLEARLPPDTPRPRLR